MIKCTTNVSATALVKIDNVRKLAATETGGGFGGKMTEVASSPFLTVALVKKCY